MCVQVSAPRQEEQKQNAPARSHCCSPPPPVQALVTSPWPLLARPAGPCPQTGAQCLLVEPEVGGQPRAQPQGAVGRGLGLCSA